MAQKLMTLSEKQQKLVRAIVTVKTQEVQALLNEGMDVNFATAAGWTPLHYVAHFGMDKSAELLLAAGARADILNDEGQAPLHMAAGKGYAGMVALFLSDAHPKPAADSDVRTGGKAAATSLILASENGHAATVAVLLDAGANITATDTLGMSPAHHAARRGHIEVLRLLVKAGADLAKAFDHDGWTPLHHAANNSQCETARMLLQLGCDANLKDLRGNSPYALALRDYDVEMLETLSRYSAGHVPPPSKPAPEKTGKTRVSRR